MPPPTNIIHPHLSTTNILPVPPTTNIPPFSSKYTSDIRPFSSEADKRETDQIICGQNCDKCDQNKCIKCISGFYIPEEDESQINCKKCTINNCEECKGSKDYNICKVCKKNFIPIYDENDKNLIKLCDLPCEIGEDDKCLNCSETSNKCSICIPFYTLINGKCVADYSIKAIYKSDSLSDHIKIYDNIIIILQK